MGVFTNDHNSLSNDFFTNLLDMSIDWKKSDNGQYLGTSKSSSSDIRRASRVDLVFGSNSQLRAISELYACDDSQGRFIDDFIAVWSKVMNFDRFDIK